MREIEKVAVWIRKFSNPRMNESQNCDLMTLIEDTITLNRHKFQFVGVTTKIRHESDKRPAIFATPANVLIWLNAAFSEMLDIASESSQDIVYIDIKEDEDSKTVLLSLHVDTTPHGQAESVAGALEHLADKIPGSSNFNVKTTARFFEINIRFPLLNYIGCELVDRTISVKNKIRPIENKPCILIVDD